MLNDVSSVQLEDMEKLASYHCPGYEELPSIELYMDQMLAILDTYLSCFEIPGEEKSITPTMVNNYVKLKVIPPPRNKKYSKLHLLYLIVLGTLKHVLSISDIATLIKIQTKLYRIRRAYNFFGIELENVLKATFGTRDFSEANSIWEKTHLSKAVHSALLSFANKIYVKKCLFSFERAIELNLVESDINN